MRLSRFTFIYCILLLCILSACGLDKAGPLKTRQLVIASDFLNKNDISLFGDFSKEYNVELKIIKLPTDSILEKLKQEAFTTNIDVLILRSALDICDFQDQKLLQKILHKDKQPEIPNRFKDTSEQWYGIAIDPLVIVSRRDSLTKIRDYSDLSTVPSWTTDYKTDSDFVPLIAGMLHRVGKNNNKIYINKLIESIFQSEVNYSRPGDSLRQFPPLLTRYSSFYSDTSLYKSAYKRAKMIFPNQTKSGLFYELRCVAIVKQARNYTFALDFVNYITTDRNNQRLNNWWNTFPVSRSLSRSFPYQNARFKIYQAPIQKTCDYKESALRKIKKERKKRQIYKPGSVSVN